MIRSNCLEPLPQSIGPNHRLYSAGGIQWRCYPGAGMRPYLHASARSPGRCRPIQLEGDAFRFVEQKRVSAIAAVIGQLAEAKKRPAALAEAMVDRKLTVFEVSDKQTKAKSYLTSEQIKLKEFTDKYDVGPALPETASIAFLTVSGTRAAQLTLTEGTFDSEQALLDGLKFESIRQTKRTWVDSTVYLLNRPVMTGLLLLIGLIGLYVEMTVPALAWRAWCH